MKSNSEWICFLDMDGVLVDFDAGAFKVHNLTRDVVRKVMPPGGGFWNNYINMTDDDFFQPLEDEFWSDLEKTRYADRMIQLVEYWFGAENVCLLTAHSVRNDTCPTGKVKWIKKHYPNYLNRFYVGKNKFFCSGPLKILIDDHEPNIQEFEKGGGRGILFPAYCNRLHRKEHDPITYVRERLRRIIKYPKMRNGY